MSLVVGEKVWVFWEVDDEVQKWWKASIDKFVKTGVRIRWSDDSGLNIISHNMIDNWIRKRNEKDLGDGEDEDEESSSNSKSSKSSKSSSQQQQMEGCGG